MTATGAAAPSPDNEHPSLRWEASIQRYEAGDATNPPPRNAVLFVGSSTIGIWHSLQDDFPSIPVINRGFGGSHMADVLYYADRVILPYAPRQIVLYAGDNDLAAGKSPEQVFGDFTSLVAHVRAALPDVRIAVISIKPSPSRWHLEVSICKLNNLIRGVTLCDEHLAYIDVFTPMLDADGKPREELFSEDGVHMNAQGYVLWRKIVRDYVH